MSTLISVIDGKLKQLEELGYKVFAQNLRAARNRFEADDFRVLIAGEFSRGKSTFINALLGEEVLASSLLRLPVTNLVKIGEKRMVRAGQPGNLKEIAIEEISEEYPRVELTWDKPFLQEGIKLVEYPSMSEAPDEEAFRAEVMKADLVIVVVAADSLYSKVEADAVEQIIHSSGHRKLIFIANVFDRIAKKDWEEVKRAAYIRLPVNQDRIFFISSQNALEGEEEWKEGIEAVRNKIREEASNQKELKLSRLRQLVKGGLEKIEQQQEKAEQNRSKAATQAETKIVAIRKNLRDLQSLNSRIQRDLLSFRDGTRDVLQEKISSFNRELAKNVEVWGLAHEGKNLANHLNEKIKQAVLDFSEHDFAKYFQKRLKEQEKLLENSFTRYQQQLDYLYNLLSTPTPNITVNIDSVELKPKIEQIEISEKRNVEGSILNNFSLQNLKKTPEAMLSLFGALVGSVIYSQLALFLIPVGLGATTFLLSRKGRLRSKRKNLSAYADQIRENAGKWEAKVLEQVNAEIDNMQRQLFTLFKETTQAAQDAAKIEMNNLHTDGGTRQTEVQNLIEEIREAFDK